MSISEAENICRYLRSKEIQMLSNNEWLLNCMDWYRSHPELVQIYGSLQEYVCIQWLLADLQDVQHGCLPTNCNNGNLELSGKYTVQINWIRDIGQSCYSQLRAAQNINEAESNDRVSADEPKKQSWEPNPKRVLMMEISDGLTTLKAMEYAPIPKLTEPFLPGLKVLLVGPIECRRGILFLKNNNINLLGGEVDHLFEVNSKENLLARCLNIPVSTATEERHTRNNANQSSVRTNRHQQHINRDSEDSVQMMLNDVNEENRNILMTDEDDDILCQLPDEVLDYSDNFGPPDDMLDHPDDGYPEPHELSPVLNERSFGNNRHTPSTTVLDSNGSNIPSSSVVKNIPTGLRKPNLFPSLEDLRSSECNQMGQNALKASPSVIQNNNPFKVKKAQTSPAKGSSSNLPSTSVLNAQARTKEDCDISLTESGSNSSNFSGLNTNELVHKHTNVGGNSGQSVGLQLRTSNSVEKMIVDENLYPKFKSLKVKVSSITKLKIRNGEWFCLADVVIGNESSSVSFSNEVLEKLFGVSAAESEVWRGQVATNPQFKKKLNDIIYAGQTKLKLLDCLMVLEYSSEDCTPLVISIKT